jgi:hypothetical protein
MPESLDVLATKDIIEVCEDVPTYAGWRGFLLGPAAGEDKETGELYLGYSLLIYPPPLFVGEGIKLTLEDGAFYMGPNFATAMAIDHSLTLDGLRDFLRTAQ